MTPEQEYLAYVRRDIDCGVLNEQGALELVGKLEAAWTERDSARADRNRCALVNAGLRERAARVEHLLAEACCCAVLSERAERAEAKYEEERNEHAEHCLQWSLMEARVRALCDIPDADPDVLYFVYVYQIRAAIEGDSV